jgi:hypothetical protein
MLVVVINGMYQIPSNCHCPSLAHTTHNFVTFWHRLGKDGTSFKIQFKNIATWSLESKILAMWALPQKQKKG